MSAGPVLVSWRSSSGAVTVNGAVAVLLAVLDSGVVVAAMAVLTKAPG